MRKGAKGMPLTLDVMAQNIVSLIDSASSSQTLDGMTWYSTAHDFCAALAMQHGQDSANVIAACAALSPKTPWTVNQNYLIKLVTRFSAGLDRAACVQGLGLPASAAKAYECMTGNRAALGGDKVTAFNQNILHAGTDLSVTVDGHAYNIVLHGLERFAITKAAKMNATCYAEACAAYREAGKHYGITGAQAQAIAWVVYRALK